MPILVASVKIIVVHILCFYKEYRQMVFLSLDNIVRRSTLEMCRLVGYYHLWQQTLQQVFQSRAI